MYSEIKWKNYRRRSKYGNKDSKYDGQIYHSKFESKVAQDLDLQLKAKEIKKWDRQVKISLDVNGMHICNYYIDFVVEHNDGIIEYIEAKGFKTQLWRVKWKIFEALYRYKENVKLTIIKL